MENKYILAIILIIVAILLASGFFVGDQQIDVAGCKAQWKTTPTTVAKSELCLQNQCTAQPADQQHNALVDATLCACEKARAGSYADETANKRIEEVFSSAFSYQASVSEICDNPGSVLVKRAYG